MKRVGWDGAPEGEWQDRAYKLSLDQGAVVFRKNGIESTVINPDRCAKSVS